MIEKTDCFQSNKDVATLKETFYAGMERPYCTYPEKELLSDACKTVAVFARKDERIGYAARSVAVGNAGSCIASLSEGIIKDKITALLLKCCELDLSEIIVLTKEEKDFLRLGIEGGFERPFYDV